MPDYEALNKMVRKHKAEPYEDTYFPGIADYDIFNRPSWEE